MLSVWTELCFK
ncbi:unnamed protein product, partial [Allacma fusca]